MQLSTFVLLTITGLGIGALYFLIASGPLADLRPDGCPQLRARRAAHDRYVRVVVDRAADRDQGRVARIPASGFCGILFAGLCAAPDRSHPDQAALPPHIEQVLVTVGLALALVALIEAIWGSTQQQYRVPPSLYQTTSVLGANIANNTFSRSARRSRPRRPARLPALHALRPDHPGRRREPGDGDRARDRREEGIHARVRHRWPRRRHRRRPVRRPLRGVRPEPGDLAPDLRVHRRDHRRPGLDRRVGGRRSRRRPPPAVRQLLRRGPPRRLVARRHRRHAPPDGRPPAQAVRPGGHTARLA